MGVAASRAVIEKQLGDHGRGPTADRTKRRKESWQSDISGRFAAVRGRVRITSGVLRIWT